MRPLNTDAFLYVKLTAQQVDDERTTVDGRLHNSLTYISQQLISVLSISMFVGTDDRVQWHG